VSNSTSRQTQVPRTWNARVRRMRYVQPC